MVKQFIANQLLPFLTLLATGIIFFYTFMKLSGYNLSFLKDKGLLFAWIVSLIAVLGSLFYSEIMGYAPCELCWYQRILIYPQFIILSVALIRENKNIFFYLLPLNMLSAATSTYHYMVQRADVATSCSNTAVSCQTSYLFHYGFITIPVMALVTAILIVIFTYSAKYEVNH